MVVCKFFQQGNCRFGQNCRFEHIYGSKYSYNANAGQQTTYQPTQTPNTITDEQLVHQVQADIQSVIQGKQWILSSYAPFKEKPNFPGLTDLSPEETRLFIYEAKASNTLDQALSYFNNLVQDSRSKHEQLLVPTPNMVKTFRSLYKGEAAPCPFTNTQQNTTYGPSSNAPASVFRSAVQSNSVFGQNTAASPSIFNSQGSSNSVFGAQPRENTAARSIFAQANQSNFTNQVQTANSIFASASQQIFGQSTNNQLPQQNVSYANNTSPSATMFQRQEPQTQSVFTQNNQAGSVFPQNDANVFKQNTEKFFAASQPSNVPQANSIFAQAETKSVFGQTQQPSCDDAGIYSNIEELSQDDIEAFNSQDFQLGFIPVLPPPRMLCGF